MPPIAVRNDGVFLTRDALAIGHDEVQIARARRTGEWHRLRKGAWVASDRWEECDPTARHLLTARAVLLQLTAPAVLSHCSAAAALGLPMVEVSLDRVHVTRPTASGRRLAGVVHHAAAYEREDVVECDSLPALGPARTALDIARQWGVRAGLVAADHVLRTTTVRPADLLAAAEYMADWTGVRAPTYVARNADAGADTAIESIGRLTCLELGYEVDLQVEIVGPDGWVIARADAVLFAEQVVIEFDGAKKYTSPEALFAEKVREDRLRELGWEVVRLTWSDVMSPAIVDRKIRAAIERSRARRSAPPLRRAATT